MKNKQGILLLAVVLSATAPAFADNIPGHSKSKNDYVTFSEEFTGQQNSQGNSARCNCLSAVTKENALEASSIADASFNGKGERDSERGISLSAGMISDGHSGKLVDFGANQGASPDKDRGHGKQGEGDGDGNGTGSSGGGPSPLISVAEPGSQVLLLFGPAGLGMLSCRRETLTNAI